MTRHKSRVARIRRARRGTRKQSGGFIGALLSWFGKKTDAADTVAPTDTGAPPTAQTPPTQLPAPAGAFQPPPPPAAPGQGGGRKTRHRRRRSPRRHRK